MQKKAHAADEVRDEVASGMKSLKSHYKRALKKVKSMDNTGLILLCIVGIAGIVYFENGLLNFIALIVFSYAFYIFANREGYRDGFYDGEQKSKSETAIQE